MRFVKRLANSILTYVPNMIHICPNIRIHYQHYSMVYKVEATFSQSAGSEPRKTLN